jgi:hypothetical protein
MKDAAREWFTGGGEFAGETGLADMIARHYSTEAARVQELREAAEWIGTSSNFETLLAAKKRLRKARGGICVCYDGDTSRCPLHQTAQQAAELRSVDTAAGNTVGLIESPDSPGFTVHASGQASGPTAEEIAIRHFPRAVYGMEHVWAGDVQRCVAAIHAFAARQSERIAELEREVYVLSAIRANAGKTIGILCDETIPNWQKRAEAAERRLQEMAKALRSIREDALQEMKADEGRFVRRVEHDISNLLRMKIESSVSAIERRRS